MEACTIYNEWFAVIFDYDTAYFSRLLTGVEYYSPGPFFDEYQHALVWC